MMARGDPVAAEGAGTSGFGAGYEPRLSGSALEPHVLIPAFAMLLLLVVGATTWHLVRVERESARRYATESVRELTETYEAQVVRALYTVDQTLRFVKYAYEAREHPGLLAELDAKGLLPPALVFGVVVADANGTVVSTNRARDAASIAADREFAALRLGATGTLVSAPVAGRRRGEWELRFSRRIERPDGSFAGAVVMSVDPSYFTSGYERTRLGDHGVLGIVGSDGVVRAKRSGETLTVGEVIDYAETFADMDGDDASPELRLNPWDGVARYTGARRLHDSTMTAFVGVSEAEQLEPMEQRTRAYMVYAAMATAAILALAALLTHVGRRIIGERKRAEADLVQRNTALTDLNAQLSQAHAQLVQSEKLASIGQLAAGVAHEINNPVAYVFSNFGTLQRYLEGVFGMLAAYERAEAVTPSPATVAALRESRAKFELDYLKKEIPMLLDESREGLKRVRDIVQNLKDFSRVDHAQAWEMADVHLGIESTLNIIASEIKYQADVVKEYGELPLIECLPSEINQVIMNLLVNAAQATGGRRGQIRIRTGALHDAVFIEVSDDGSGIDAANLPRIFDPFFTTKPIGKGTGLGLSLSYGIVKKHGGAIDVTSAAGQGATFRVTLPVHRATVAEPALADH